MRDIEKKLAKTLVDSLDGATAAQMKQTMKDFVSFLGTEGLISKWRGIEQQIHSAWKEKYGASQITIVTAEPITEAMRTSLEKMAPGADLTERVDERIIGGAVIRIDDKKIDGSLAGSLRRLKQVLES